MMNFMVCEFYLNKKKKKTQERIGRNSKQLKRDNSFQKFCYKGEQINETIPGTESGIKRKYF